MFVKRCLLIAAIAGVMLSLALGCANAPRRSPTASPSPVPQVVLDEEPWTSFPGATGTLIRTNAFRVYTTARSKLLRERLPVLAETALVRYRSALGDLPAPPVKLDTYLMQNRQQWARLTTILMRERAEPYLRIARGGFAADGRGLFWDIGPSDTLSLAAHEGWHQYTQRTFETRLPPWLEEGIATYHEGFRWPLTSGRPEFLPWSNTDRFDQLRDAHAKGRLKSFREFTRLAPGDLIGRSETAALDWYAQVWAAVLFLEEAKGGRYQEPLQELLTDASTGRLWARLSRQDPAIARAALRARGGGVVISAYADVDLDALDRDYREFVETVVAPGTRGMIVEGRSPIETR